MATTKRPSTTKKASKATTSRSAVKKSAAKAASAATKSTKRLKKLEDKAEKLKRLDRVGVSRRVRGFVEFLREQSVVGLAIGLVLGTQAKALVDQLIASFINPLVGLLLPGQGTLDKKEFLVHLNGKTAAFRWGAFAIAVLTFVIVAAVVYFTFKGLRLDRLDKKKEKE